MTSTAEAMSRVPRRLFVPSVVWADLGPGPWVRISREDDPARWADVVEADIPLVTQFDDGGAEDAGQASSSCSMPSMVAAFLEELDLHEGDRVLEIGTGTGWTAALLSELSGDSANVTTVEVDPQLAARATRCLKEAGYAPEVIKGDGAAGWPDGALYDRVHATCAVREVPRAWTAQVRPGGTVVCPFTPGFGYGHILRLRVLPEGRAVGRFAGSADYMMLRAQRPAAGSADRWAEAAHPAAESVTRLDPRLLEWAPDPAELMIAALVPGVVSRMYEADDSSGEATFWLLDAAGPGGSWASADYDPGGGVYPVQQAGDRRLWDEAEAAYYAWLEAGQPDLSRFGLTITPGGHFLWLDHPGNPIVPQAERPSGLAHGSISPGGVAGSVGGCGSRNSGTG